MKEFYKRLTSVASFLTLFIFLSLCAVAFLQVVMRYFFNNSLPWPEEVCSYLFLALSYLGMALCFRDNSHLRIDILLLYVPAKTRKLLDIITILADIAFCCILVGLGSYLTWDVMDMEQLAVSFPLPVWIIVLIIPVMGVLMLLYVLKNFIAVCKNEL